MSFYTETAREIQLFEEKSALNSALRRGTKEGEKIGMQKGLKKGIKEGLQTAKLETAKKMLSLNEPIEKIALITDLSLEDIEKLKAANG